MGNLQSLHTAIRDPGKRRENVDHWLLLLRGATGADGGEKSIV